MSFHWLVGDIIKEDAAFATVPSRERPRRSVADTELEAMLDLHRAWVESNGKSGMRLELAHADFEGMDLTGANLQGAVLNGANLQGSELLLADLRGASLVQANLQEANLLGADLRGANLEGATLVGAAGLHTTQLAGASLLWSMLPSSIAEFEGQNLAQARARHCYHVLLATLALCALCCLRIFTARDVQFLNDAPLLRVLPSSGVIPIATFFLVMPIVLFGLFVYLHIALQRLWEQLGELPSIFPDGHSLDRTGPWILMTLFQARFRGWRANWVAPSALQMIAPFALAYWAVPATLFLFWARYLVMQDIRGALLQILLLMLSVGIAMQLPRVRDEGVPGAAPVRSVETIEDPISKSDESNEAPGDDHSAADSSLENVSLDASSLDDSESEPDFVALAEPIQNQEFRGEAPPAPAIAPEVKKPRRAQAAMQRLIFAAALGVFLLILTLGVDYGVPHDSSVMPDVSQASLLRWSADAFWTLGYRPYANLTEASISTVPKNWSWRDDDLSVVKGAQLNDLRLRYAEAYRTIWINAHLWKADLRGAYFSESDFRGANLREANLHSTFFDRVRFFRANLHGADLEMANLTRADMRETDLSYAKLGNAILVDTHLGNANLFGADLHSAQLAHASIESADLRDANLMNADLKLASLQDAYLWSTKLPGADLKDADLKGAILIEASLRDSNLEGADLQGAVLRGTDFSGANIAGADLRGATGLTPAQICSAKNRTGAQFDDSLAPLVEAQCGATPASAASATAPASASPSSSSQPK
ncbi:MAG TPA: pentapeptide repeat-containing protein [Candidatus Acidoferrales bacterium]|nr:pentapeptide repeat-containing protein [Candidatus Acidoferrales bacterium]